MTPTHDHQTLAERLAKGPLALPEALGCAVQLAEALRRLHATGGVHGMVTPGNAILTGTSIELAPAGTATITPYSSPEQLQDCPPEPHSDIFSFGAVLYELVTGRRAFNGDTPESLKEAILTSCPPPAGDAELDRLIANCLEKNPTARWQRIQQVLVELRLMLTLTRRRETRATGVRRDVETVLRAELHQLELAVAARLEQQEKSVAASLEASRKEHGSAVNAVCEALEQLRKGFGDLSAQVSAAEERANRAEQIFNQAGQEIRQAQGTLSSDFGQLLESVTVQAETVQSVKSAMAKTDDLVERVVEALDALQNMVLDQVEARVA